MRVSGYVFCVLARLRTSLGVVFFGWPNFYFLGPGRGSKLQFLEHFEKNGFFSELSGSQ